MADTEELARWEAQRSALEVQLDQVQKAWKKEKLGAEIDESHYKAVAVAMGYAKRIQDMARKR